MRFVARSPQGETKEMPKPLIIQVEILTQLSKEAWAVTGHVELAFNLTVVRFAGNKSATPKDEKVISERMAIVFMMHFLNTTYFDWVAEQGWPFDPEKVAAGAHIEGLGSVYVTADGQRLHDLGANSVN